MRLYCPDETQPGFFLPFALSAVLHLLFVGASGLWFLWAVWVNVKGISGSPPGGFCEKPSTTHGCSTICMFTPGYGMLGSYFSYIFMETWVTLPIRKAQCQAWIQPQTRC